MKKKEIVDDVTMKRAITRITYEIIERNKNLDKIVLAGIKTRGVYIAQRIQERLKQLENLDVPLIELDTKAFRDDVKAEQDTSVFPIEIDGTTYKSYEDLKRAFAEAVDKDKATLSNGSVKFDNTVSLKEKLFKKLLQQTDSFKTSIFK